MASQGERTALLGANGHAQQQQRDSWSSPTSLTHVLFEPRVTPGRDSRNVAVRAAAHAWHVTKNTLLSSYVNVLLVFVPLGIVAGKLGWDSTLVFSLNFVAIMPLAAVLSFATEQFAEQLGDTMGALVNASLGNAVELIVSIVALKNGQIAVVQSSMLGSIISNLLLVMGLCFVIGGTIHMTDRQGNGTEQRFAFATGQLTGTLMTLSSASMIVPAAVYATLDQQPEDTDIMSAILQISRGTAVVLLVLYVLFLVFQLRTHKNLFSAQNEPDAIAAAGHQDEEGEEPIMSPWAAVAVLVVTTVLISVCADYLVEKIDDIVDSAGISRNFIGLILIPIVGNAAEHATACVMAAKNKMDLALGVAVGSSVQIAIFVTPFLVLLGWAMGQPLSLHFSSFETVAFALSVLVVSYTLQDGRANYLEGAMLLGLYVIIAIAILAVPGTPAGHM